MKLYRTAKHPEFINEVILPALEDNGLPASLALHIATLMDSGQTVKNAVRILQTIMNGYGEIDNAINK